MTSAWLQEVRSRLASWSQLAADGKIEQLKEDMTATDVLGRFEAAIDFTLHRAILTKDEPLLRAMVGFGASLNGREDGTSALETPIETGSLGMVRLLLELGADPNVELMAVGTPLHLAAGEGHVDIADMLLRFGANINAVRIDDYFTPLMHAASHGNREMVRLLLRKGADPRFRNSLGESALSVSAQNCRDLLGEQ